MSTWTYVQIDVIPILALLLILQNSFVRFPTLRSIRRFQSLILLVLAILDVDGINWYFMAKPEPYPEVLFWIINILYFLLTEAIAFSWFLYVLYQVNENQLTKRQIRGVMLSAIPLAVVCLIILLSPWNHWIFYLDENGVYQRGAYHLIQVACGFGFMLVASILAYRKSRQEVLYEKKKEYRFLSYVAILPFIGGVLQIINYNLVLLWSFTAAALFLIYVDFQGHQISVDALTMLNNRGNLERFLQERVQENVPGWYLVMMDVDRFKLINDRYGHLEGDRAIQLIAKSLREIFGVSKAFIARFGGDEFTIITEVQSQEQLEKDIRHLREYLDYQVQIHKLPYQLQLSVGYVLFENKERTPGDVLLELADRRMYEQKSEHKMKYQVRGGK